MRVLELFAGVGMFSYGLHKLGWETVAFVEIDSWCQRVLQKNYPGVPIYSDVREVTRERLEKDGIMADADGGLRYGRECEPQRQAEGRRAGGETPIQPAGIDIITGGFPCTDISVAGKQAGIGEGTRSGLWSEFARIIGEVRPRYVIVENVAALLSGGSGRWMGRVLGDLAEIGYDAEWHCIPAGNPDGLSAGAPHRRERVWIVAYPQSARGETCNSNGMETEQRQPQRYGDPESSGGETRNVPHPRHPQPSGRDETQADHEGCSGTRIQERREPAPPCAAADTASQRGCSGNPGGQDAENAGQLAGSAGRNGTGMETGQSLASVDLLAHGIAAGLSRPRWLAEPRIGRIATGVPDRVNKLKALGNGLVWQIPYAIGQAIMEREA